MSDGLTEAWKGTYFSSKSKQVDSSTNSSKSKEKK